MPRVPLPSYSYRAAVADMLIAATDGQPLSAAEMRRILRLHGLPEDPNTPSTVMVASEMAPGAGLAPEGDVRYASAKQKEEIIRLLNNPVVTRAEKTKMLLSINKLDDQRAALAIENLRTAIKVREGEQRVAA